MDGLWTLTAQQPRIPSRGKSKAVCVFCNKSTKSPQFHCLSFNRSDASSCWPGVFGHKAGVPLSAPSSLPADLQQLLQDSDAVGTWYPHHTKPSLEKFPCLACHFHYQVRACRKG